MLEAADRFGGVIQSTQRDGFVIEHSADSFIVSDELPWAGELCRQIGLELIETDARYRGALILRNGRFHRVPDGLHLMSITRLAPLLGSPLLSWRGKLRAAYEPLIPRRADEGEESLADFATRRMGREMFERIVQPLVAGIYTADPERLSVQAALPQFATMEREHGSLARAIAKRKKKNHDSTDSGARYRLFRSPHGGMQTLIDTLIQQLERAELRTDTAVSGLSQDAEGGWKIEDGDGATDHFDAVILATSSRAAAQLLSPVDASLAATTAAIDHATTAVICLGYRQDQVRHPLNAFGCVIPAIERRRILAVSFTHVKFPNRAPAGHVLLRVFVGGALQSPLAELSDDELTQLARGELSELLGVHGSPCVQQIVRWPHTTPLYYLGHQRRLRQIEEQVQRLPGLRLAGNAYRGVGIPQCVHSGWQAAESLLR